MKWIALVFAIDAAGCGPSPRQGPSDSKPTSQLGARTESSRVISCTPGRDGGRVRAHFGHGSSLRELVVWYTAVTCRTVIVSAELLDRTTRDSIDAMVTTDRVHDLFRSRLQELGVREAHSRDDVVILGDQNDAAVFTGVEETKP